MTLAFLTGMREKWDYRSKICDLIKDPILKEGFVDSALHFSVLSVFAFNLYGIKRNTVTPARLN